MIVHDAKVQHYCVPVIGKKNFKLARANVINRYYFVRKNPELSSKLFFWAVSGHILANILLGIATIRKNKILNAFGSMSGVLNIMKSDLGANNRDFHK
jgi:hypothetical protein